VADAEIIPLGTRGRPGRGSGRDKPSASSRGLAGNGGRRTSSSAAEASSSAEHGHDTFEAAVEHAGDAHVPGVAPAAADDAGTDALAPADASPPVTGDEGASADASEGTTTREAAPAAAAVTAPVGPEGDGARLGPVPMQDLLAAATHAARVVFGDDADRKLAQTLAFLRRRVTGDYVVDEYGLDQEIVETFLMEMVRPLATKWFRVEVRGVENIPTDGGALVVANHSGTIPVDGIMTMFAVHETTGRNLRPLGADLVFKLPFIGELARKAGATLACSEDATRMLSHGELAAVWPEGFKGIGKPYSERYKLQRFGRGGFVSAAIRTGVPIVPCSIVGAEEIYPLVGNIPSLARLLGVPYIPITPFFPLLGPLGLVPLPSKWIIEFGEPIRTDSYDPGAADDPMLVFNLTDQVRETIQQTLYSLLMRRKSVFH
jgi:1-acyl-sn-glycerol-3-phosphate acyltransferase